MRNKGPALFLLLISSLAFGRDMTDALGVTTVLPDSPKRIVTLMPSLGELAAELSDDLSVIVGVSEFTDYPPALKKTTSVGPYHQISLEKVAALKPDVVFASFNGNSKDQILHLREIGVPVVTLKTDSIAEIAPAIQLMGDALGKTDEGRKLAQRFNDRIAAMKAARAKRTGPPKRVILQIGDNPFVVVGGKSILNEALEFVGGVNPYKNAAQAYPRPSREDAFRQKPDLVLILALNGNAAVLRRGTPFWEGQVKQVKILAADSLLRPSFRFLEGLMLLEKAVFGTPEAVR